MYAHALAADPPESHAARIFTSTDWLQELVESDDDDEDVATDIMPDSHEVTGLLTFTLPYHVVPLKIDVTGATLVAGSSTAGKVEIWP